MSIVSRRLRLVVLAAIAVPLLLARASSAIPSDGASARRAARSTPADVPLDLEWTAPDGCPSQAQVASDARRLAGTSKGATRVHSIAVVTRTSAGGWRVQVATVSDAGRDDRSMEGESCEAVAAATALFVALAVDPERGAPTSPSSGVEGAARSTDAPSPPASAPLAEPPPIAREPSPAAPIVSERSRLSVGASSRVDVGTLPRAALGAELSAGWRTSRILLEVAAAAWLTQSALLSRAPPFGGTFSLISASLRGCYDLLRASSLALGPCAAGQLDHVDAGGYGSLVPATGSTWWFALAAGATVAWRFTPQSALRGLVEADAPLTHPSFLVDNTAARYRAAVVTARAGLGVELTFP